MAQLTSWENRDLTLIYLIPKCPPSHRNMLCHTPTQRNSPTVRQEPGQCPRLTPAGGQDHGGLEGLGMFLSLSSLVTFDLQAEELKAKERRTMFESFIPITVHLANTDQPSEASVPS